MKHVKAYGLCLYKISNKNIELILCKGVSSKKSWGFLKGVLHKGETPKECARREVKEESSIDVDPVFFEEYFEQINEEKDVGIWLVNIDNLTFIKEMFYEKKLLNNYLSWENKKVKFFNINSLPKIKDKQGKLFLEVMDFLQNKS